MVDDANASETNSSRIIVGTMSGTSADGVDAAVTRVTGRALDMRAQLLLHRHRAYEPEIRGEIFAFRNGSVRDDVLGRLARLGRKISLATAAAINDALLAAKLAPDDVTAVAVHGQTLFHDPPDTIQWIDPALVAHETRCQVVSDFRRADLAANGQGAPLVPFADYVLFRSREIDRAVVNIGGIANVTCLFRGSGFDKVIAFDTGPGNCISDHLMRTHFPAGPGVDIGGELALSGTPDRQLLDSIRAHAFFTIRGPKSTDGPQMILLFEAAVRSLGRPISLEDQLATAAMLTATEIASALHLFGGQFLGQLIISGGGTENRAIMEHLRFQIGSAVPIKSTDEFGIPSQAKESIAFALLAAATLDGVPSNVPSVTGATHPVILGSITPKPA